jgi:hypothetical protein
MRAIRHVQLVVAGLVVLVFLAGPVPALWVALALVAFVAVNRSPRLLRGGDRAVLIAGILTGLSLAIALAAVVLLFVGYSWIPAVGYVVLWIVYLGTAETPHDRSRRRASSLRDDLVKLVRQRVARSITDDQLTTRADTLLEARMVGSDFATDAARATLTGADGLSPAEHRQLLQVMARYLGRTERGGPPFRLHETVRERLGSG